MELIAKEYDVHFYLVNHNGNMVRLYADTLSSQIYVNLDDLPVLCDPAGMKQPELGELKENLCNTLNQIYY